MRYEPQIRAFAKQIEAFVNSGSKLRLELSYHHVPGGKHHLQRIFTKGYETLLTAETARDLYQQMIGFYKGIPIGHHYWKQR